MALKRIPLKNKIPKKNSALETKMTERRLLFQDRAKTSTKLLFHTVN
jgi:hypothetical protein